MILVLPVTDKFEAFVLPVSFKAGYVTESEPDVDAFVKLGHVKAVLLQPAKEGDVYVT